MAIPILGRTRDDVPKKVNVGTVHRLVRVILIDGRPGNPNTRIELIGMLDIPAPLMAGLVRTTWRFDELKEPLRGAVCDPQAAGCNIVFPITSPSDAADAKTGRGLSMHELKLLVQRYHPTLKED